MPATSTDGFLLVDKPAGRTSHDVVTAARRAVGAARAGHTGTLDPFATGLLVVLLGSATRLARFVPAEPKTYEAVIAFGVETDTDDATGTPTARVPLPDGDRVHAAIAQLTGHFVQTPPAFSAKHVGGQRAHALARRGAALDLPAVPVTVDGWEILGHQDDLWAVRIRCGAGTYVRALARDLGRLAGSAAHLRALRRTAIGPFEVSSAQSLEEVRAAPHLRPPIEALPGLAREVLDAAGVALVRQGRAVVARSVGERAALLDAAGRLVAVAERDESGAHEVRWQPRVVLPDA